jgi:hypothetical protein
MTQIRSASTALICGYKLIACNGRVGYVMIGGDESGITEVNYFTESGFHYTEARKRPTSGT